MIILSHTTALHCYRHLGAEAVLAMPRRNAKDLAGPFDAFEQAVERYRTFAESAEMELAPLHVVRFRGWRVRRHDYVRVHLLGDVPPKSFVELGNGVYAVCPELLICQLASWGDLLDTTHLLYEMLGTYLHPSSASVLLEERKSFTTKTRLQRYLAARAQFSGIVNLRKALELTRERSASHMETAFAMLLGFPYRLGGFDFPDFEMNYRIVVPRRLRKEVGRAASTVDLCWPDRKVAFEYDSTKYHDSALRMAKDSSKRNGLARMGYQLITVAGGQVSDRAEVVRAIAVLANAVGHRIQPRCRKYKERRDRLMWFVFRDQASIYSGFPNARSAGLHPKPIKREDEGERDSSDTK